MKPGAPGKRGEAQDESTVGSRRKEGSQGCGGLASDSLCPIRAQQLLGRRGRGGKGGGGRSKEEEREKERGRRAMLSSSY